jgi:rubrerythrin
MRILFSSPQSQDVELLKNALSEAGIPCEVRNENAYAFFPGAEFYPELWVLNDDDFTKASEMRDALLRSASAPAKSWICRACGEESEGQFNSCWQCGVIREAGN